MLRSGSRKTVMSNAAEQILELARWAPSGDNTQPWRFQIMNEFHIAVHGFDTREYCLYDLNGFGSQLAHGALLETICLAATGLHLRADISRRSGTPETLPIYDILLHTDEQIEPDVLLPFIEQRCTQRRVLSTTSLTQDEKRELTASVGNFYTLLWIDGWQGRWSVARLLFANAKIRLTIPEAYEVHRDIIEWNASESVDRIPDAAVGLDPFTLKLMRWAMGSWQRVSFLNKYLAGHLIPRIELDLLPALFCAGHFILLRNNVSEGIDDNVEAGRAVQRFWLTATKLGLQMQPEITPLVFSRYVREKLPLSQVCAANREAHRLAVVLDRLAGGQSANAVFMGRLGHGQRPQARSRRISLPGLEVGTDETGGIAGNPAVSSEGANG